MTLLVPHGVVLTRVGKSPICRGRIFPKTEGSREYMPIKTIGFLLLIFLLKFETLLEVLH